MADAAEGGGTRGNDANDESETNDGGEDHDDDDEHDDCDTLLIHAVDRGETALETLPSEVATIQN